MGTLTYRIRSEEIETLAAYDRVRQAVSSTTRIDPPTALALIEDWMHR